MSDSDFYLEQFLERAKKLQAEILKIVMTRIGLISDMWEVNRCVPEFIEFPRNTTLLDKSDFAKMTKLSSAEVQPKLTKNGSNVVNMLANRQKDCPFSSHTKCDIYNRYIPNKFDILVGYPGDIYCSQFTKDGRYFITASEDNKLKIYNSENGAYNIEKSMDISNIIWDITDLNCSSNNEYVVYTSQSPAVNICKLAGGCKEEYPLVVADLRDIIGSVSFSADSKELVCGSTHGNVYIYDLESGRRTLKFLGHENNVTSVRFADDSRNILYSAGNDGIVKLWDRRIWSTRHPKPVRHLTGHRMGIMYMDLRGDGRHLITHSNDQTIKLWDVRVLSSAEVAKESSRSVLNYLIKDCLVSHIPSRENKPTGLKDDTSIMTFRGHSVGHKTIRCRFSPVETTGQKYIYTGCDSGSVVVYDALTGEAIQHNVGHATSVFNVSWHPTRNEILSSGSDGLVGIWTYMDHNTMVEPEHIEKYRKHFSNYKLQDGLLLDPARKYNL